MNFELECTSKKIEKQLCRIRAKHAHQRSKQHSIHLLTANDKSNYHLNKDDSLSEQIELLNSILPPRRKWKNLTKKERYSAKNGEKLNSIEINTGSLIKTIRYYRKNDPSEPFIEKLDIFINDVLNSINDSDYRIEKPEIIPSLKEKKNTFDKMTIRYPNNLYIYT